MTKYFDSHCHLDPVEYEDGIEVILNNARDVGVARMLTVACDIQSARNAVALAGNPPEGLEIWASVGVHPHDASSFADGVPAELEALAADDRVVALGEMGLDFFYDNSPRDVQRRVFAEQVDWARRAGKPIITHLRNAVEPGAEGDAYSQAMEIMIAHDARECGGVIHCFSGDYENARSALDMGFYISFAGPLTFPRSEALRDVARQIPLDRILCETDSPYLAPQSRRGRKNEPANVREVYEKLAEVRGEQLDVVAEAIWANGERLFRG